MSFHGNAFFVGPYLISPHPDAPIFSTQDSAQAHFNHVLSEMTSPNFNPNEEAIGLIRQLGLTSLYFLLNCILAPYGPYDKISDAISLDMCNFRQSDRCLMPGAQAAGFIPRGFFKSTIFDHGGMTFDLLRNPNERGVIVNAISDKAMEFFHLVERNFDSNELMGLFYPKHIPGKQGGKISDKEMILPNRARESVEPTLRSLGLTGAGEGGHYSILSLDDLVGLDAINSQRQSSSMMEIAKKWFRTNRKALRLDKNSRLIVSATRYAMDDVYEDIYKSCVSITGWTKGDLQPIPQGQWHIYYRLVEEDGVYLRPDIMGKREMEELIRDDYWAAMTQYYNSPLKAGLAEFANLMVKECALRWDEKRKEYYIEQRPSSNYALEDEDRTCVFLSECDVVMSTDLAATDTGVSAKTCRTSIAVWAKDGRNNVYRIWQKVGYLSIGQSLDAIFEGNAFFNGAVRVTYVEANAFQKIMKPIIENEMLTRGQYFCVDPIMAAGDKKARIRVGLGTYLARGQVWLNEGCATEFLQELRQFPMGTKLDVLDESEKGLSGTIRPETDGERERRELDEYNEPRGSLTSLSAVGY